MWMCPLEVHTSYSIEWDINYTNKIFKILKKTHKTEDFSITSKTKKEHLSISAHTGH